MARIEIVHLHTRTPDEARRIIDGIAAQLGKPPLKPVRVLKKPAPKKKEA